MKEEIKLTSFSKGAGCGCKIAPADLEEILKGHKSQANERLLVGNDTGDDAAVYDIENGRAVISTVDFFMPIVDDPYDFGRISAANALSDVYAMGGRPLFANAILGWPVEKLSSEIASEVLRGGRETCRAAGIPLAGGHSIDSAEPIFGLSVTGEVRKEHLKRNSSSTEGDALFLTKPLGFGILTTAHKRGIADAKDFEETVNLMTSLNSAGTEYGELDYVTAMTDVTGFGLLGHLTEMCRSSGLSAELEYKQIPLLENLEVYVKKMIYPDITFRNWKAVEEGVTGIGPDSLLTLCDPQTSGGLLVSIKADRIKDFNEFNRSKNLEATEIGKLSERAPHLISVLS